MATRQEKIQELIDAIAIELEEQSVLTDSGYESFGYDHAYTAAHYIVTALDEKKLLKI